MGNQTPLGQHLIIDGYGCDRETLTDVSGIHQFLDGAPSAMGMTKMMEPCIIEFHPTPFWPHYGLTGFIVLAESHISVHTFPEFLYLSLDIFSCKKFNVRDATQVVIDHFKIAQMEVNLFGRGFPSRFVGKEKRPWKQFS